MNAAMPPLHLYQIAYSADTLAAVEPGYRVLNNLDNPRPDWYEYGPIRRFLQSEVLDDAALYGFFSPKFAGKTGRSHAQVEAFIRSGPPQTDVFLFSPQPDMGAFFLNVFEQGEAFNPGLMGAFSAFLDAIGRSTVLKKLVMDSRHTVYSNYFVARPAFWREWLRWCEALFALCEGPESPLRDTLTQATSYTGSVQRKVFLIERMASFLLCTQPQWRTHAANPYTTGWRDPNFRAHATEAFINDALKLAFRELAYPEYMMAFSHLRNQFGAPASSPSHPSTPSPSAS